MTWYSGQCKSDTCWVITLESGSGIDLLYGVEFDCIEYRGLDTGIL